MSKFTDYWKLQIEWVKSFLSDPSGKGSSKRASGIAVIAVFLIAYLKIALVQKDLLDIPATWAFLIAGIIGLGIVNNHIEGKYGMLNNTTDNGTVVNPPLQPPAH